MRTFRLLKEAFWPGAAFKIQPGTVVAFADDTPQNVLDKFAGFPEFWQEVTAKPASGKAQRSYESDT